MSFDDMFSSFVFSLVTIRKRRTDVNVLGFCTQEN